MASPKFTKQHYEVIAALFSERRRVLHEALNTVSNDEIGGHAAEVAILVYRFAEVFGNDNPRFNRQRFLDAAEEVS